MPGRKRKADREEVVRQEVEKLLRQSEGGSPVEIPGLKKLKEAGTGSQGASECRQGILARLAELGFLVAPGKGGKPDMATRGAGEAKAAPSDLLYATPWF